MLARKNSSQNGKSAPADWIESVSRLLNETYKSECKQNDRYFDVFAQIYPEEFLLGVSYLSEKDEYLTPITLFLSSEADHLSDENKVKETQKNYIDLVGLFFDEIFTTEDWNEFEPEWQEVSHKNHTYFFRLSRENVNATLEADRLLGEF